MSSGRKRPSVAAQKAFMAGFLDFDALERICARIPEVGAVKGVNPRILIPNDLYKTLHDFYGRSLALAEAVENVLNDGEHQVLYAEAQSLGYRLPDITEIHDDLEEYRAFLTGFDAYDVQPYKRGQVRMGLETAKGHRENLIRSSVFLRKLWQGSFETEYMNHFTALRNKGFAYSGETAFQQMMNIAIGFTKTDKANEKYLQQRPIRKYWPELLKH